MKVLDGATGPHDRAGAPTRVFVVDDHCVVREGLRSLIGSDPGLAFAGSAATVTEASASIPQANAEVVVLDLALGDGDGLELLSWLADHAPQVRPLVLSMHDEALFAQRALRLGAKGYVMKGASDGRLLDAVHRVAAGRVYLSEAMTERLVEQASGGAHRTPHALECLTDRELQVLRLVGEGTSTTQIARSLGRSAKTIESHRANIKRKLGLRNGFEFLRYATRWVHESGGAVPDAHSDE